MQLPTDLPHILAGASWLGGRRQGGHGSSNFFDIVGFSENLMLSRKIFGLLLLVKKKGYEILSENH